MKITIFGATGKVGQQFIDQALQDGHILIAHTRNHQKITRQHENLTVVEGDVLDPASVEAAIKGSEVVICVLGMPLLNKDRLRSKGTQNIVAAMEKTGVKRLVCLSALGAGDSFDMLPGYYKYLIVPLAMRHLFADHNAQEAVIRNSSLDWTIARPGNFTGGTHTGHYQHGFTKIDKSIKIKISAADVADFLRRQIDDDTYLHKAAALSY